jgi:hypothetical protein
VTGDPFPPSLPGDASSFPSVVSYRDQKSFSTLVCVLLALNVALSLALIGSTIAETDLLQRAQSGSPFTFDEVSANDQRQQAISIGGIVALAIAGVAWLVWQHRAHTNLTALGAGELRFTPGWAVGWWFVPFANLVRPPQVMSELIRASDPASGRAENADPKTPRIVWVWWLIWVIGGLMTYAVSRVSTDDLASLLTRDRILIATEALHAIAAVLAILLVRRVQKLQSERAVQAAS